MLKSKDFLITQVMLIFTEIVVLFHTKANFTFMVVQITQTKFPSLIATIQKHVPVLSLILLVEHVKVTAIIYFFAFQLKIIDCAIKQKVLYLKNGGNGSLS